MSGRTVTGGEQAIELLVARAQDGDREALEAVIGAVQRDVRALAGRFFWHPEDAEDASQEILVRIVTRLASFRGDSRFSTWAYRVATNTLLSMRKRRLEEPAMSFEELGEDLAAGLCDRVPAVAAAAEEAVLLEEVKIGCTHAMLQCLDRAHRLAYILGEILELDHREAAVVVGLSPAAYRQRLSRARRRITEFMTGHCGLFDRANACRCRRRLEPAIRLGRVDPERPLFVFDASRARRFPEVLAQIRRLEATRRAAAILRSHPEPETRDDLAPRLRRLIAAGLP